MVILITSNLFLFSSKPLLYKNGVGQYDLNNNLVNEFTCKYDCIRDLKMSDKTLTKSLQNNVSYNGVFL